MNKQHKLVVANKQYPGGLRFIECEECEYTFAAEIDNHGLLQMETKVTISQGDFEASHSLFQTPEIRLELNVSADSDNDDYE